MYEMGTEGMKEGLGFSWCQPTSKGTTCVRALDVEQSLHDFVDERVEHRADERPAHVQVAVPQHCRRGRADHNVLGRLVHQAVG